MKKINTEIVAKVYLLVLICALLTYVILRATLLSFTHDESLSFKTILGFSEYTRTANNHFLNTWLMYLSYKIFGANELSLRLPNVFAFVLYSFFAFKILIRSKHFLLLILGSAVLFLNPYLLEFFSMARGYGLSLGFALASIYFLMRNENVKDFKLFAINFSFSLLSSLFASYSCFVLLNLNITILIVFIIELIVLWQNQSLKLNKNNISLLAAIVALNFMLLIPLVDQIFILKDTNELYFGGRNNFIDDTVKILVQRSIYYSYYGELFWQRILQFIIIVFASGVLYQLVSKKFNQLARIVIVLTLMIYASVLQHYVFDTLYPVERTALIFIPLFGLFLFFLVYEMVLVKPDWMPGRLLTYFVSLSVFVFLSVHLINSINLKQTHDWKYDSNTKEVMLEIIKERNKDSKLKLTDISISSNWLFVPTMNYYRTVFSMDYLTTVEREGINSTSNFIYCNEEESSQMFPSDSIVQLRYFDNTKTTLFKRVLFN